MKKWNFKLSTPEKIILFAAVIFVLVLSYGVPELIFKNKIKTASEAGLQNTYHVMKVVDGDTIDVDIDGKKESVRLIGINTPETVDPRKPVQCFGVEASDKAKETLNGKNVTLKADATQSNRDKYGRLLRYVYLEDGTNFNEMMVRDGYAYEYTYDVPYEYQAEFMAAQQEAKNEERGLWAKNTCDGKLAKTK